LEKLAFICCGGGRNAFKTAIKKINEYNNEKMELVFLVCKQTEICQGGTVELIDTLSKFLTLSRIKELYLKYGIGVLLKFKDKIDENRQRIAFESFFINELDLQTSLRELKPMKDYSRLNLNSSNLRKRGKEIKSWNKTKFYQK
jgi:hypothetical protein